MSENDSLKRTDILESSLGQVRSAKIANSATNADRLDNLDSTQLSPATGDGRTPIWL